MTHPNNMPKELTVCGHLCRWVPLPRPTWVSEAAPNGTSVDLSCLGLYEGESRLRWRAEMCFAGVFFASGEGLTVEQAEKALRLAVLMRGESYLRGGLGEDRGSNDLEGAADHAAALARFDADLDGVPA